ncbi:MULTISPECIES: lactococcin 972 family bacteriocin [unclassified Corynebacterium]|uniref:lactococcin 972 family bacteriocin n=1 Tax=unclassified Corynebacterium TaxID=2624378 RepID=UPI0029CA72A9|nr:MULTISPECIES: lactococcin 972 family bacteriocin [unclassified Corynebacterium]WPF66572.1 lactococcin 972 family bacteriocin [Corynebacterium sp. 22KM0430]WPF69061.1 lactococcin 972 family bacteriocin [Corynebacterium sp. 21KM1197]
MPFSKKISRGLAATALSGALVAGGAAAALAAQVNVGGGIWTYGTDGGQVYSNYYHPTARHGSTAVGTITANSGCVNPGLTSYASAPKKWRGNQSYYRLC